MKEPTTPEEFELVKLQEEWIRDAGKIFRVCDNYTILNKNQEHHFVSLNKLKPVIDSLQILPILDVFRLSIKNMKALRDPNQLIGRSISYIQFGEVRVEGFPHWEPIVAPFSLVSELFQNAKNEWDRCRFIKDKQGDASVDNITTRYAENIDKEIILADEKVKKVNSLSGFMTFSGAGLILDKLSLYERVF